MDLRIPRSDIEAMSSSNMLNAEGDWIAVEYKHFMWITMQPSMRGAHKVPRRHLASRIHHWKGKILELKQGKDGKRLAKVRHVYTLAQLKLDDYNARRFPANCKYKMLLLLLLIGVCYFCPLFIPDL